ncbi:MAG TPA: hypothetical protein ACFYD7_12650 [Candidatus Wujingus californicus]|uniref:hypothetical protein n=1 Tax=Candidatus Wujingus californicus TaxID=3367618 RepID=UPI004028943F
MKFEVLENLVLKTSKGDIELRKGQVIEIQPEKVTKLLESGKLQPLPYLDNGILRIPFDSDKRYRWWQKGQSITETLRELNASDEIVRRYKSPYSDN